MTSVPKVVITGVAIVAPGKAEYQWTPPDLTGLYSVSGGCGGFTNYGGGGTLEAQASGGQQEESVIRGPILSMDAVLSGACVVDIDPNGNSDVTCFVSISGYDEPLRYDPDGTWTAEHKSSSQSDPFVLVIGSPSGGAASVASPTHGHGHSKKKH